MEAGEIMDFLTASGKSVEKENQKERKNIFFSFFASETLMFWEKTDKYSLA